MELLIPWRRISSARPQCTATR